MILFKKTTTQLFIVGLLLLVSMPVFAQNEGDVSLTEPEQLLEVDVVWDRDTITGNPSIRFESAGLVTRTKPQPVYLTIQTATGVPSRVCTFNENYGSQFGVSYPSCATGNQNIPLVVSGVPVLLPQVEYFVNFTDNDGNVINSQAGDGSYLLPKIPAPALPNNLLNVQSSTRPHPDGGEYYSVTVSMNQTIPGQTLEFYLRTEDSGVFVETPIGSAQVVATSVTLPTTVPEEPLSNGSYELVARYNGVNYEVIQLTQRIGGGTSANNGSSSGAVTISTGGFFNSTQTDILNNGLVSNCGYDIKTLSNPDGTGRACGLSDLITLIQRLIEYIFMLILPIAAIVFVYVGYLFLTSGGNPDKRKTAKKAMVSLVTGIVIIMAAWLIVRTILLGLGVNTEIAEQFLDLDS